MKRRLFGHCSQALMFVFLITMSPAAWAQYWASFSSDTRYMALGDSITAGYAAHPATEGFVYRLYRTGVIDDVNHTLFCNTGVPDAKSSDVLSYQVPQVKLFFKNTGEPYRQVITLTVGGNDLLRVLDGEDPAVLLTTFGGNLANILGRLVNEFPGAAIYVANVYDPKLPVPNESLLIAALNNIIKDVVQLFSPNAVLVDVFSAFEGKKGLLLNEKNAGNDSFQVHPTDVGYKVIEDAFADAISSSR